MWRDSIKFSRQSSQRCSWESSKCLPCKSKTLVYLTRLESTNIILSPSTNFIKGHWTSRGFQHIVSKYDENYRTPPAYWQLFQPHSLWYKENCVFNYNTFWKEFSFQTNWHAFSEHLPTIDHCSITQVLWGMFYYSWV